MEDYSSWSNKEVTTKMFTGMSMEIVSVFVDYDDDNRITFNLLNGETVVQPRPPGDTDRNAIGNVLNSSQNMTYLEDLRLWNVVKAHWQSQLSLWPGLVHTWVHFHFNDLVCWRCSCSLSSTVRDSLH